MKILHVIDSLDPNRGGPPAVVLQLVAAQAQIADEAAVLTYDIAPDEAKRIGDTIAAIPGADKIRLIHAPPGGLLERITGRFIADRAAEVLDGFDFVHLHSIWTSDTRAVAKRCRATSKPYAICLHGMLDEWSMRQGRLKKRIALTLSIRPMLNAAAFIHVLSSAEARQTEPYRLRAPTRTIPNGISAHEFAELPAPGAFRAAHPEIGAKPYVLFLSRLHPVKGLDILAGAFATARESVPDAKLVVAGPDYGALDDLKQHIADLGIKDAVHITGPLYGPDKKAALRDAACFCLPSRHEGFSIAICEALATGLPCVVSQESNFDEIQTAGAGRVCPLDEDAFARALSDVLGDEQLRTSMGRAARSLVMDNYTWDRIAQRSIDLYREFVD